MPRETSSDVAASSRLGSTEILYYVRPEPVEGRSCRLGFDRLRANGI